MFKQSEAQNLQSDIHSNLHQHCKPDTILFNKIKDLPQELRELTEDELKLKHRYDQKDYVLRLKFWKTLEMARSNSFKGLKTYISNTDIANGILEPVAFLRWIQNPLKVAFMLLPIPSYQDNLEALDVIASERLQEIINLPIKCEKTVKKKKDDPDEEPKKEVYYNTKNAELVFRAIQEVNNRLRGGPIQRSMTIQQNIHQTIPLSPQVDQKLLDDKIKELISIKEADPKAYQEVIDGEVSESRSEADSESYSPTET